MQPSGLGLVMISFGNMVMSRRQLLLKRYRSDEFRWRFPIILISIFPHSWTRGKPCVPRFRAFVGKRLRGYVLTCFHWFPTFVFQNPNESKMETKEMVISAQAAKLYERTWARFNQMSSIIPTMTLRSLCRDSRVNYCGMQEWMAQHGYAEPERADTGKGRASDPIGTSEENPTFLQLNPVSLPQSMAHDILRQVSITFSEGTVLTLQECSPEGVVSLLDTYARRRSAMEGTCLR